MSKQERYFKTKKGLVAKMYSAQKTNSKRRKMRQPEYTSEEFKDWLYSQCLFHELYSEWVNSGHEKLLIPSVDRINSSVHYCFKNIKLMTWGENRQKAISSEINRPVKMIDKNTREVIKVFNSGVEAGDYLGSDSSTISKVCKGKLKTSAGFTWEYN